MDRISQTPIVEDAANWGNGETAGAPAIILAV